MSTAARLMLGALGAIILLCLLAAVFGGGSGSGPANAGRFVMLLVVLPLSALLMLAIWYLRGWPQKIAIGVAGLLSAWMFVIVGVVVAVPFFR